MCGTCGCGTDDPVTIVNLQTGETTPMTVPGDPRHRGEARLHPVGHEHLHSDGTVHSHPHEHGRPHEGALEHGHVRGTTVDLEMRVLARNDALAGRNRAWFAGREILALNILGSPGSGKTTLLERTICDLKHTRSLFVIEGDQATSADGARIRDAGAPVVQVNTGAGCHLDARMVARGLQELKPGPGSLVLVENVGNLVCPALFDLGETARVLLFSVVEGEDKPLKYPHMFRSADVVLLNKADLLPHVDFDVEQAIANIRQVNPRASVLQVSSRTGEGLDKWRAWLEERRSAEGTFDWA